MSSNLADVGMRTNTYIFLQIVLSEDGKYGRPDPESGEWSGMVGMILRGKGDLIAADLTTTFKRQEVLDFSRSFMSSPLTVLTKARRREEKG